MSGKIMKSILSIAVFGALAAVLLAGSARAREITDMAGRKVSIPDTIRKVYAPSPYGSYALYSIDPSLVSGLIFPIKEEDKKYVGRSLRDLPVIGSLFGQGQTANIEVLLKARPDLIVMWSAQKSAINEKTEETLKKLNVPYVYAVTESLYEYPAVYRFLGKVLGREERTEKLASYCQKTLAEAKAAVGRVPVEARPAVYYAEGVDGLSTECNDSIHVELLRIAGDRDVHRCHTSSHMGMEKVSLEQVMHIQPRCRHSPGEDLLRQRAEGPAVAGGEGGEGGTGLPDPPGPLQLVRPAAVLHAHHGVEMAHELRLPGGAKGGHRERGEGILQAVPRGRPFE